MDKGVLIEVNLAQLLLLGCGSYLVNPLEAWCMYVLLIFPRFAMIEVCRSSEVSMRFVTGN